MKFSQTKSFAILRITFGFIWLIDAFFKWTPSFVNNFTDYLADGAIGQPEVIHTWINFWINMVSTNPNLFAIIVALIETAIAIGLIFGLFTKITIYGGIALSLVIWTTAEGLGGPYVPGSTDIGAAIIYALVFVALWIGRSWKTYSIDSIIEKHYPNFLGKW